MDNEIGLIEKLKIEVQVLEKKISEKKVRQKQYSKEKMLTMWEYYENWVNEIQLEISKKNDEIYSEREKFIQNIP